MQRITALIFIVPIALAACVYVPQNQTQQRDQDAQEPEERIEETATFNIEELTTGTGALAERLLPTGVIDIGLRSAPVTFLLFTEHYSRYTREFQREHLPQLLKDFIEPGFLHFQIVILPLKKYPKSEEAAAGLLCAAMQGKGMFMHHTLSQRLDRERMSPDFYAEELGLNVEEFRECMESGEIQIILDQQKSWAQSLDVTLVPTFFLNGEKHVGLPYYADLKGMIEEKLR